MIDRLSDFQAILRQTMTWRGIRIGAIATAAALMAPILDAETATAQRPTRQSPNTERVTIDDIIDNPTSYDGRFVTIRSQADETDQPYAFVLDDNDGINLFGLDFDDDELLVFNAAGTPLALPDESDVEVQITGIVRPFVRAEIERELGVALDPQFYAEYENQPAVFAQSVAYAPDPGEVTAAPEAFYGRSIVVEGNVDDVYSSSAFSLNDPAWFDGEDLLVINTVPDRSVNEDAAVVIVGELRPFVRADIEREYSLGADLGLPGNLEAEYEQQPVLVVREIYPSSR